MPRVSISITNEFYDAIVLYQHSRQQKSTSEAIVELAFVGLKTNQKVTGIAPREQWGGMRFCSMGRGGYVYFMFNSRDNIIKIGSTNNPAMRAKQLGSREKTKIELLGVVDNIVYDDDELDNTENRLHKQFNHLRLYDEWFSAEEDLIAYIYENAVAFTQQDARRIEQDRQSCHIPDELMSVSQIVLEYGITRANVYDAMKRGKLEYTMHHNRRLRLVSKDDAQARWGAKK